MGAPAVLVEDLVIEYTSGGYVVRPIDGLHLEVQAGELVVLLGPSGSGKTTLLSALGAILQPTRGRITCAGIDVGGLEGSALDAYRQRTVGFVFQAFNLIASLSARENVAIPLLLAGQGRRPALRRADALLERVGLLEQRHRRPAKLSGGQQQRVAIARGLAADPPVLLADEPTANLDYIQAEGIISLLRDLRSDGRAIIVSTHDDRIVPIADRSVHLMHVPGSDEGGPRLLSVDPGEVIFEQGDRGDRVYVIEEGAVRITRRKGDGSDDLLADLGPGEYFGELGPLLGFPRSARATAVAPTRLTAYDVHDFRTLVLGESP